MNFSICFLLPHFAEQSIATRAHAACPVFVHLHCIEVHLALLFYILRRHRNLACSAAGESTLTVCYDGLLCHSSRVMVWTGCRAQKEYEIFSEEFLIYFKNRLAKKNSLGVIALFDISKFQKYSEKKFIREIIEK